jgi:hypothetical protein
LSSADRAHLNAGKKLTNRGPIGGRTEEAKAVIGSDGKPLYLTDEDREALHDIKLCLRETGNKRLSVFLKTSVLAEYASYETLLHLPVRRPKS